uniref:Uncharacterized protein n=1 Tax=Arundo donax TaxID=35708 RepID=A0A0A9AV50_ARUDO
MEEASSSSTHRDSAFWESLAAALLRASSPTKAHLVIPLLLLHSPVTQDAVQFIYFEFLSLRQTQEEISISPMGQNAACNAYH